MSASVARDQEVDVKYELQNVLTKIQAAEARRASDLPQIKSRLVAVSKIKPASMIAQAYEAGQREFGENYVNELAEKAVDPLILESCKEIKWHFIGHLQTNKINKLLGTPGLFMVQTVHSETLADNLNKQWLKFRKDGEKLKVMVQVNTSEEEAKNGVPPSEATKLSQHVTKNCPNLEYVGLMTIGQYYYDVSKGPNPDFITLAKCRDEVCKNLNLDIKNVELSMGMSIDYEQARERAFKRKNIQVSGAHGNEDDVALPVSDLTTNKNGATSRSNKIESLAKELEVSAL